MLKRCLVLVAVFFLLSLGAFAQSLPTATLSGKVTADGAELPGVTVTVSSPQLQGTRSVTTTGAGDYVIPFLPPGSYTVTYELSGMQKVTKKLSLAAATPQRLDIVLRPSAMSESITVTAETPLTAAVEATQVSTNFKQDLIQSLPVTRTLQSVTLLAPGVNSNGPGGNIIISGAMSFDSLYLVNGAIVNENLRGQPHSLFIEDAIQETTVITGAVPAEYGHFTGGVVSAITKSGGNDFSGSFRSNLSNESWVAKTPLTVEQSDTINATYEATVGGPFMRDRLWFFGAGRFANPKDIRQTEPGLARAGDQDAAGNAIAVGSPLPVVTYPHSTRETRLEGKLTGTISRNHTIVASYLDIAATEKNQTGQVIMDLDSLVPNRETPNTLLALNYNGMLSNKFFIEGQYSKKEFAFLHSGSSYYDIIKGTLITDRARGTRYWSPTFRNTPDGEHRNVEVYTAKGTYFWSTPRTGSHEFKLGYEDFNEVRKVNNYQNGSDYRISVSSTIVRGGQIFPVMGGGATGTTTRISYLPILVPSLGSDYTTRSSYLQDHWVFNDNWTFDLGVRYDKNDAISGAHTFTIADDSAFSPRLSVHYDPFANSRLVFTAGYGEYVGRLAEGAANDADPAGRNASFQWNYRGPGINTNVNLPTSQLTPTDQAIKQVMDWFMAQGGPNLRPFRTTPSLPGVESVLDVNGLDSPMVKEYSFGVGSAIGTRGYVRADFIKRNWDNFYTSYRSISNGKVTAYGTQYDLSIIRTDNSVYDRDYTGVQTQFNYRLFDRLNLGGTYTWSRLTGNVTGEDSGSGPLVGGAGEYPEYRQASWNYPTGYLTGDQRHRARLWATYQMPSRIGNFSLSALQQFDSATRTSVDGDIDSRPFVTNPGYLTPPATVTYYFGGRGNLKTDDIYRTDLALDYRLNLGRGMQLFVQPQILNVFNRQGVQSYDEEVNTAVDDSATFAAFNPFTETPKECPQGAAAADCKAMGANFQRGPNFGLPAEESDYQTPRTYRLTFGLRF